MQVYALSKITGLYLQYTHIKPHETYKIKKTCLENMSSTGIYTPLLLVFEPSC